MKFSSVCEATPQRQTEMEKSSAFGVAKKDLLLLLLLLLFLCSKRKQMYCSRRRRRRRSLKTSEEEKESTNQLEKQITKKPKQKFLEFFVTVSLENRKFAAGI
jgi:hypothetical protein